MNFCRALPGERNTCRLDKQRELRVTRTDFKYSVRISSMHKTDAGASDAYWNSIDLFVLLLLQRKLSCCRGLGLTGANMERLASGDILFKNKSNLQCCKSGCSFHVMCPHPLQ